MGFYPRYRSGPSMKGPIGTAATTRGSYSRPKKIPSLHPDYYYQTGPPPPLPLQIHFRRRSFDQSSPLLHHLNGSEEVRLKYLEFVHAAAIHAIVCFSTLYVYAKDKAGPLKPGVEAVESTVKMVVGPVYDKYYDVPI